MLSLVYNAGNIASTAKGQVAAQRLHRAGRQWDVQGPGSGHSHTDSNAAFTVWVTPCPKYSKHRVLWTLKGHMDMWTLKALLAVNVLKVKAIYSGSAPLAHIQP